MKFIFSLLLLLTINLSLSAQHFEKVSFGDSEDDYYLALKPEGEILATIVLMPGFGQNPESVFPETTIPNVAYSRGLLTLIIAGGQKLHCDSTVINKLDKGLSHAVEKFGLKKELFVMGGYSAGGTISLRYTELSHENPVQFPITPKAVFSIDSPVDIVELWHYFQRELKRDFSAVGTGEARFISALMQREIGHPDRDLKKYQELSPFSYALAEPGNERFLKDIPVRTYADIDVEWLLKQRGRSLYDTNSLNASELISRLRLMGNEDAEFITSKQPGMRSNGLRHPHSWSIVAPVDFIDWAIMALRR